MMRITTEAAGAAAYAQSLSGVQNFQTARSIGKNQESGGAFDQVNISGASSGESRFQKELAARLVQEVRTATTTGDIQQLHEQVASGAYRLDASSIASAMLLGG